MLEALAQLCNHQGFATEALEAKRHEGLKDRPDSREYFYKEERGIVKIGGKANYTKRLVKCRNATGEVEKGRGGHSLW